MDVSNLSLNSITVKSLSLDELISQAVARGIVGIAPWRDLLQPMGTRRASKTIQQAGLRVSSLCRGGMFTAPDQRGRAEAIEDNRRAIAEAHELAAESLVLVCGPVIGKDMDGSRAMVRDGIGEILREAREANVRLAIEPLHPMLAADRSVICRLDEAVDLCGYFGPDAPLGVIVDAYHVWWDVGLHTAVENATSRILGVHVSDWVSPLTGGLASGRGMMGDGVIDLPRLVSLCRQAGYGGLVEVEILSDYWWGQPPERTLDTLIERFTSCV